MVLISSQRLGEVPAAPDPRRPRRDVDVLARELERCVVVDPDTWPALAPGWGRLLARVAGAPWGMAAAAVHQARAVGPLLALSDDVGVRCALLLRGLPRRRRPRLLVVCHHLVGRRVRVVFARLRCAGVVDAFLLLTRGQVPLTERLGIRPSAVRHLGLFVDTEFFRPSEVATQRLVAAAGATGRDYPTLIAAAASLDAEVVIEARSIWAGSIDAGSGATNVRAAGLGGTDELRDLYDRSAVIAVPLADVPNVVGATVVLEAMAMAKPAVVTALPALGELLRDDVAVLVPPGEVGALAAALRTLLDDDELRHRLGARGRELAEREHAIEGYAPAVLAAVEAVDPLGPAPLRSA